MPTFNSFDLDDGSYITSRVDYRSQPRKDQVVVKVAGRDGAKLLSSQFGEKKITLSGSIVGTDPSDLKTKIDNLHRYVTSQVEKSLVIDSGRTYTATTESVMISDAKYAQDYSPFEIVFTCADPFAYQSLHSVSLTVASGTASLSSLVTISGSIYAEPTVKFSASGSSGFTSTSGIRLDHTESGTFVTWSGSSSIRTVPYGDYVSFDYEHQLVTTSGLNYSYGGNMNTEWNPGDNNFTTTFSGLTQGGVLTLEYNPRWI